MNMTVVDNVWNQKALDEALNKEETALKYVHSVVSSLPFVNFRDTKVTLASRVDAAFGLDRYSITYRVSNYDFDYLESIGVIRVTDQEELITLLNRFRIPPQGAAKGLYVLTPRAVLRLILSFSKKSEPIYRLKKAFGMGKTDLIKLTGDQRVREQKPTERINLTAVKEETPAKAVFNGNGNGKSAEVTEPVLSTAALDQALESPEDAIGKLLESYRNKLDYLATQESTVDSEIGKLASQIETLKGEINVLAEIRSKVFADKEKVAKLVSHTQALLDLSKEV